MPRKSSAAAAGSRGSSKKSPVKKDKGKKGNVAEVPKGVAFSPDGDRRAGGSAFDSSPAQETAGVGGQMSQSAFSLGNETQGGCHTPYPGGSRGPTEGLEDPFIDTPKGHLTGPPGGSLMSQHQGVPGTSVQSMTAAKPSHLFAERHNTVAGQAGVLPVVFPSDISTNPQHSASHGVHHGSLFLQSQEAVFDPGAQQQDPNPRDTMGAPGIIGQPTALNPALRQDP